MIMMRSTSAPKTGKPPPPVPPRPSKINNSSDSLTRTKRLAPNVPSKPSVPLRSAPPPPTSRVHQLREAFTVENGENKTNPIVKSQSYSAVNFGRKPSLERSISQDGNKKTRTVIFESSNLKSSAEIKLKESDTRVEKVQVVNGSNEPEKENKLDSNRNEVKTECAYTMDIMHEMLADAIKKEMDEENKTKITIHNDDEGNTKNEEPKATVLVIEDEYNKTNLAEVKTDEVSTKDSEDNESNSSTSERKKDRHVKFDDKMNHELLISELQNMKMEQERIMKRQRKPSKEIYDDETPKDQPKILHSDWIEVNDGEEVRLSSCQITIDERTITTKEASNSVDSVDPLISRLSTMSNLHGLPPLPKSLSNFNFLEGPQTPNRSRNTTSPMPNTGTHLVYPPHPKPVVNGGATSQTNVSNLDAQLAILRREMSKFSSRARAWADATNSNTSAKIKLRMDHDVKLPSSKSVNEMDFSNKDALNKLFKDFIDVKVQDLSLDLTMSTVTGLADLIEDEIIPIPIPLQVNLNNVQLHMIEDRPPVNITSPGPVPLDLNITHMFITREEDGVFNIIPNKPVSHSESIVSITKEQETLLKQQNNQLKLDNDELKRRLAAFERVSEENRQLRRSKEETDILRSCLSSAQDDVSRLLDEKKKLLDDVKRLQDQLLSDRNRQWNTKR